MKKPIPALWIQAVPKEGFRRAGHHWPHEGIGIALDALTEQQIEALRNEPLLKVTDVEFDAEDASETDTHATGSGETGMDAGAAEVAERDQQGVAAQEPDAQEPGAQKSGEKKASAPKANSKSPKGSK